MTIYRNPDGKRAKTARQAVDRWSEYAAALEEQLRDLIGECEGHEFGCRFCGVQLGSTHTVFCPVMFKKDWLKKNTKVIK